MLIFDLEEHLAFEDDSFISGCNKVLTKLTEDIEKSIEAKTKWLKQSGLKVNDAKTELCVFHRTDTRPVEINFNDSMLQSKNHINVLGITFDTKLQWHLQVAQSFSK